MVIDGHENGQARVGPSVKLFGFDLAKDDERLEREIRLKDVVFDSFSVTLRAFSGRLWLFFEPFWPGRGSS